MSKLMKTIMIQRTSPFPPPKFFFPRNTDYKEPCASILYNSIHITQQPGKTIYFFFSLSLSLSVVLFYLSNFFFCLFFFPSSSFVLAHLQYLSPAFHFPSFYLSLYIFLCLGEFFVLVGVAVKKTCKVWCDLDE